MKHIINVIKIIETGLMGRTAFNVNAKFDVNLW